MGLKGSKIGPASIKTLTKQLNEIYLPDDRNIVMDCFDHIDIRLENKKTFVTDVRDLKDQDTLYIMLKALKKLAEDVEIVTMFVQILDKVRMETPLVMDFIQYGGLDIIAKCMRLHEKDEFLAMTVPRVLKIILMIGARASIEEIQKEAVHLQLCQCCQGIIERQRHPLGIAAKIVIPKPSDRLMRVLRFMDNYLDRVDVQIAGLDAVLKYSRNADAKATARNTDVIDIVVKVVKQHKANKAVLWRVCMDFLKIAIEEIDKARIKKEEELRERERQALLTLKSKKGMIKAATTKTDTLAGQTDQQPAGAAEQQSVPLPAQIKRFLRETNGKVYREKSTGKSKAPPTKQRRNYDERPKFGTVDDRIFVPGEDGLIKKENEDDNGDKQRPSADWEAHLQYGEQKNEKI
eukprot:scaffold6042_cov247-Ochromonas_danica.AAC.22